ncbi:MAG: 23S rRNA (adenine(2030)-N(6))-methyltransferase RlmJ [Steroidobacteraceae bacterium]
MNYRHSFHAGNFADVHKHLTLLAVLDYLLQKPKPFLYLDTHAGRGEYDLRSDDAIRSNEWQQGIGRIFTAQLASPLLKRYVEVIHKAQQGAGKLHCYPGSPLIAAHVLRDTDRRVFVEKQAEECVALRKLLRQPQHHISNTTVDDGDGYHALSAYLPPREKRGVVLIDAPFEEADEFKQLEYALIQAAERWPTGVYCLWYPIKSGGLVNPFYAGLKRSGLRNLLRAELLVRPADTPLGLNGSGMLIMNPPWQLDSNLRTAYAELLPILAPEATGSLRVEWLARE